MINAYFKKKIKLPSKNPTLQLRKPNVGRRKEIMKIRAEINQIENLKKNRKRTKLELFFFKKRYIDKS